MERHTFATSVYVAAPRERIYDYLSDLGNLDEWTLFSRMRQKIDESTWLGTASGFQRDLYYHLHKSDAGPLKSIQWHCGFELGKYAQIYPVLIFPPEYLDPSSQEIGAYLHWISFFGPSRRNAMIDAGIASVHTAECRSLKAVLEHEAGLSHAAVGRFGIESETLYIDAPLEVGLEYLADVRNMLGYAFMWRQNGRVDADEGDLVDKYGRRLLMRSRTHAMSNAYLVEHEATYPDEGGLVLRAPTFLIACATAFGDPSARGFIKHRVTFWPCDGRRWIGPAGIEEYRAESINVKRMLEAKVGHLESFARGPSYVPPSSK